MINYLNKRGASIGSGTRFNCTLKTFGSEPWLITCGENCLIAEDVKFITHDGGIKVLNSLGYFAHNMDIQAPITIGNNVYIGMGAYIMPGVNIGDNVIVGARAMVTKDIPSGMVAVGIPAHCIETVEEYYKKIIKSNKLFDFSKIDEAKHLNTHQK